MKILKFFISLSLILSVSLINSIAAISVSDGSAFVTKAEFAADLNNLSNRMSSLENSLDAKIDSLVSSYLSRNGIWNGEKQTFLDYTEEKLWPNKWCTKATGDEVVTNDLVSICETTKSGLFNLQFEIISKVALGSSNTAQATIMRFTSNSTNSSAPRAVITVKYDICDILNKNVVIFSSAIIAQTYYSINVVKVMDLFLPSFFCNNFFFVQKGVTLGMRLVFTCEGGNWSDTYFVRNTNYSYCNPNLKFLEASIY